jgi:hypothetical protein
VSKSSVEVVGADNQHVRYVPGPLAEAMVKGATAVIAHQNGRVRSIRLVAAASTHAQVIGPPTGTWVAPPFTRRVRSDDHAHVWWEHHPRSTYQ